MPTADDIKHWILQGLPDAQIEIDGDGRHFFATVASAKFAGISRIQQHQIIYDILGSRMDSEIHALSLQTKALDA